MGHAWQLPTRGLLAPHASSVVPGPRPTAALGRAGGVEPFPPGPVHAKPRRARPAAPARVRCTRVGCTRVHQQEADSSPLHAGGRLSAPEETTGSEGCHSRRYCPDARPRATEMREGELAGPVEWSFCTVREAINETGRQPTECRRHSLAKHLVRS